MSAAENISCLIVLYIRTEFLEELLSRCVAMKVRNLYVALDGPKDESDKIAQELLIAKLNSFTKCNQIVVQISHLSRNRGIFVNMVTALDWFFQENTFGIILEDDTLPSPFFMDFVLSRKLDFENDPKTLMISGWRGENSNADKEIGAELSSYPLIWGWATSREKWMMMRKWFFENVNLGCEKVSCFSPSHGFWYTGYKRAILGKLDSWANVLAFNFLIGGFKSIVPTSTLITNVGFDEFATNTQIEKRERPTPSSMSQPLNLPLDDWLSQEVFHISYRHIFAPIYAPIIDFILRRKPKREPPLALLRHSRNQAKSALDLRSSL